MIFIDPFAVTKLKLLLVNVNNYLASHLVKLLAIAQHVLDDIQPVQTSNKEVEDALWSYMYYLSLKKLPKIIFCGLFDFMLLSSNDTNNFDCRRKNQIIVKLEPLAVVTVPAVCQPVANQEEAPRNAGAFFSHPYGETNQGNS